MRDEVPVTGGRTKPAAIMGAGRMPAPSNTVVWHDLECGSYHEDLELWRELAEAHDGPILDVGAGTGRVTLDLARRGHHVVALDADADLLAALAERAEGLNVETVAADARGFDLGERRFELVIVPMQTLQLLGGEEGRAAFLRAARAHMAPGGLLAAALADPMEGVTDDRTEPPLPDLDGRPMTLLLVKNPAGANEVLRTLSLEGGDLDLLGVLNDRTADGRDVSWVWDADFEVIADRVRRVTCSGTRAAELAVRFKYAGVDPDRIAVVDDLPEAIETARADGDGPLYALPTYTAMLDLRQVLHGRALA